MSKALLLAIVASLLVGFPVQAFETYKVIGISAGDSLVIREEPVEGGKVAEWKERGRIPASAVDVLGTGRSKLIGQQRWYEVAHGGNQGWVNGTFLEGGETADLKGVTFSCAGTEPFWGVTLAGNGAGTYTDPEEQPVTLSLEQVQAATARHFPLFYRGKGSNGRTYRATIARQSWCTDGMSDYEYGFQILLTDDEVFQEGCCFIKR